MAAWYDYLNPVYDYKKLAGTSTAPVQAPSATGLDTGGVVNPYPPGSPEWVRMETDLAAHGDPKVAAAAAARLRLKPNPDGTFTDPATGATYNDQTGATPVAQPNVAQQTLANTKLAGQFNDLQPGDRAVTAGAVQGQQGLAGSLNDTINNPNASSVAQTQLGMGQDAINRQQLSLAAGTTGPNAFLASRNAANNISTGQEQNNQQQALLRAQDVASAQGRLSGVLNNIAGEGQAAYATDVGGQESSLNRALNGEAGSEGLNVNSANTFDKNTNDIASTAIGAANKGASAGGAGGMAGK